MSFGKIRITGGPAAHSCAVALDGFDISNMVQAVRFNSDLRTGDIVRVELTLVGELEVDLVVNTSKPIPVEVGA